MGGGAAPAAGGKRTRIDDYMEALEAGDKAYRRRWSVIRKYKRMLAFQSKENLTTLLQSITARVRDDSMPQGCQDLYKYLLDNKKADDKFKTKDAWCFYIKA